MLVPDRPKERVISPARGDPVLSDTPQIFMVTKPSSRSPPDIKSGLGRLPFVENTMQSTR